MNNTLTSAAEGEGDIGAGAEGGVDLGQNTVSAYLVSFEVTERQVDSLTDVGYIFTVVSFLEPHPRFPSMSSRGGGGPDTKLRVILAKIIHTPALTCPPH